MAHDCRKLKNYYTKYFLSEYKFTKNLVFIQL